MRDDSSELGSLIRFPEGTLLDYSSLRTVAFSEAINYYGAAGGGPWVGYQGTPTLLLALAATGNVLALCSMEGRITDATFNASLKALSDVYMQIKIEIDPF